jgi:FkbM family methyltransferase
VIAHGAGRGLRFEATGGYPGYLLGTSEPEEQAFLEEHLGPGDVFYDIGANIGFFSTVGGRLVLPGGSVFAFEPFPESAARARENAARNGFGHVIVVEAAVGGEMGRTTLAFGESSATHRLSTGPGIEVDVISVDLWRKQTGARPPTLVLIDAEGAELDVLAGMKATIEEAKPIILCEVHWLGAAFDDYVGEALIPLGYRLSALDGDLPVGRARWHAVLDPRP